MATVRTESILRQLQRVGIEHGAPPLSRDPDPVAATGFAEIVRVVREEAGAELAEAFLATSIGGESMREFVARTYPTLDERARESLCRRLHREREQLLPQLQERLAA